MLKVQTKQCVTCIYHPNSPLDVQALERKALQNDSYRVCHHSKTAVCAGYWARHKSSFNLGRIAQRLRCVQMVQEDVLK